MYVVVPLTSLDSKRSLVSFLFLVPSDPNSRIHYSSHLAFRRYKSGLFLLLFILTRLSATFCGLILCWCFNFSFFGFVMLFLSSKTGSQVIKFCADKTTCKTSGRSCTTKRKKDRKARQSRDEVFSFHFEFISFILFWRRKTTRNIFYLWFPKTHTKMSCVRTSVGGLRPEA